MRLFGILTEKERNLVNKAIIQERERIIKLLEESQIHWRCGEGCCDCLGWNGDEPINQLGYLIELIKGEK